MMAGHRIRFLPAVAIINDLRHSGTRLDKTR